MELYGCGVVGMWNYGVGELWSCGVVNLGTWGLGAWGLGEHISFGGLGTVEETLYIAYYIYMYSR